MYIILLTLSFVLTYFIVAWIFTNFFLGQHLRFSSRSWSFALYIAVMIVMIYSVSLTIPNGELSNRFLHLVGGGVLAFLMCFFVVIDQRIRLNRVQFFIFGFLIATGLGVANELLEFVLQNSINFIFSTNPYDTWLDLLSNTIGIVLAAIILLPFLPKYKKQ